MKSRVILVTVFSLCVFLINSALLSFDLFDYLNLEYKIEISTVAVIITMISYCYYLFKKKYYLAGGLIFLVDLIQLVVMINEVLGRSIILSMILMLVTIALAFVFIFSATKKSLFLRLYGILSLLYYILILVLGLVGWYYLLDISKKLFFVTTIFLILELIFENNLFNQENEELEVLDN